MDAAAPNSQPYSHSFPLPQLEHWVPFERIGPLLHICSVWFCVVSDGRCHDPDGETTVNTHPDDGLAALSQDALHAATEAVRPAMMQPMAHEGFWHAEMPPTQQWPASRHLRWQSGSAVPPTTAAAGPTTADTV